MISIVILPGFGGHVHQTKWRGSTIYFNSFQMYKTHISVKKVYLERFSKKYQICLHVK